MKLSKYQLAIIALIITNVVWGASFPIYKWSLENVPPFTFTFLRLFLGGLLVLPFTLHNLKVARRDFLSFFCMAFFGVTIPITAIFLGLELTSSINAPIILSSGPIILIIFAMIFLKEHPKKKVFYGTGISLLGVLLIIFQPVIEQGLDVSILGNLFFLITAVGTVYHTIMIKKLVARYSVMNLTFWYFVIGSLPLLPFVYFETHQTPVFQNLDFQGLFGIIFGVVFASFLAHVAYNYGIKYIQASEAGIFAYVDPLAAIVIALPLLNETLTPFFLIAAFLVFLGIFIAENRIHYHPFHKLRYTSPSKNL